MRFRARRLGQPRWHILTRRLCMWATSDTAPEAADRLIRRRVMLLENDLLIQWRACVLAWRQTTTVWCDAVSLVSAVVEALPSCPALQSALFAIYRAKDVAGSAPALDAPARGTTDQSEAR